MRACVCVCEIERETSSIDLPIKELELSSIKSAPTFNQSSCLFGPTKWYNFPISGERLTFHASRGPPRSICYEAHLPYNDEKWIYSARIEDQNKSVCHTLRPASSVLHVKKVFTHATIIFRLLPAAGQCSSRLAKPLSPRGGFGHWCILNDSRRIGLSSFYFYFFAFFCFVLFFNIEGSFRFHCS